MARKRYKKRSERIYQALCLMAIALGILISLFVSNITGKFDLNLFLILTILFVVLFGVAFIIFSLPVVKGKIGEGRVNSILKKFSKKYGGTVIHDVTIPGDNNKTSQIDHIYISEYGIYVLETKNYAGRIYGKDDNKEWTQVLAYGHTKNKLYNPVKQNLTHIYRLKQVININVSLTSVVVFLRADLTNVDSDYVYNLTGLKHLLDDKNKTIESLVVDEISKIIMEYKLNPVKSNKEHVQEIRQMKKDIDNNICPRCGGKLVLRKSKDGRRFYGCENFPNCKFTKKID